MRLMKSACTGDETAPRAPSDYHPLEAIRFFRRFRPTPWRDLLYTFIWNSLLASCFLALAPFYSPRALTVQNAVATFVIAHSIGYTIHLLFLAFGMLGLDRAVHARGGWRVVAYYTAVATCGVIGGFVIGLHLLDRPMPGFFGNPRNVLAIVFNSLIISSIIAAIFFAREREAKARAALAAERLRAERVERQATLANLRALQAQIEPHFLFNTLANAASLVDADPARAKHMLEVFIRFLRASLAATRRSTTTLADEFAMLRDFLEVLAVRMAGRLATRVDLPDALAAIEIPPMLLQPLVENAIRHGLEPKVEGGAVSIVARREAGLLVLEVADTGVGFSDSGSGGVGLANIRERLRLAHGDEGRLAIREAPGGGTVATISFPVAHA
jgi:signal transduction histidine kinase